MAKALAMPRVNLLIADDVGLGKTIEAGLVVQEMLLRHRARRVLVVCPASLTLKWREEMAERFGLDFTVLDAAALKELRRSHGLEANPFGVLPPNDHQPAVAAHTPGAAAARRGARPRDASPGVFRPADRRRGAPLRPARAGEDASATPSTASRPARCGGWASTASTACSCRATPHNGYSESWQALLEMLDPQRFARGVEPDPALVQQVMVRRLKDEIVEPDGSPTFPGREARCDRRRVHPRRSSRSPAAHALHPGAATDNGAGKRSGKRPGHAAVEEAIVLLPRRVRAHAGRAPPHPPRRTAPQGRRADTRLARRRHGVGRRLTTIAMTNDLELLNRAASLIPDINDDEQRLLDELTIWADRNSEPADSKAAALITELKALGEHGTTSVIIFTEYRDTQNWLAGICCPPVASEGADLAFCTAGWKITGASTSSTPSKPRPTGIQSASCWPPTPPARASTCRNTATASSTTTSHSTLTASNSASAVLTATGQRHIVDVAHFVGAGWEHAEAGSYEADLEFLSRVARKVAIERRDLGSVNPVLAHAVEARMLGRPVFIDPLQVSPKPETAALRAEQDLRAQGVRLRAQLARSVESMHVAPANVRRVVDTALALAVQPPLVDAAEGRVRPPELKAGWERTVRDLADPLTGEPRPMTFDPDVARDRDDVVLAHLGQPLVAQATRLLRSAVWGGRTDLNRVAAVRFSPPQGLELRGPLVTVFARLVIVGHDGSRLHEEIILAGRELPESGRGKRMDLEQRSYGDLRAAVEAALDPDQCRPAPAPLRSQLVERWDQLTPWLVEDIQHRADRQRDALARTLQRRLETDMQNTNAIFDQLRATLATALADPAFTQLTFDDIDATERQQFERDRRSWQERLDHVDADREVELEQLRRRYADVHSLVFPFAVALCVPDTVTR